MRYAVQANVNFCTLATHRNLRCQRLFVQLLRFFFCFVVDLVRWKNIQKRKLYQLKIIRVYKLNEQTNDPHHIYLFKYKQKKREMIERSFFSFANDLILMNILLTATKFIFRDSKNNRHTHTGECD